MSETRTCRLCDAVVPADADHPDTSLCEGCFKMQVRIAVKNYDSDEGE